MWGYDIAEVIIGVTAEWKDGEVVLTGNDKARVYAIGSTPIVSKDYDPNCMVSYIAGFIRKMTSQEALDERRDLSIIQLLMIHALSLLSTLCMESHCTQNLPKLLAVRDRKLKKNCCAWK